MHFTGRISDDISISLGITVAKKLDKMGMNSSDTAQIFFEDVRVPSNHIIGEAGQGFIYQMMQFQEERLFGVAVSLLPLETLIKETLEYASQRQVFGKPLIHNQVSVNLYTIFRQELVALVEQVMYTFCILQGIEGDGLRAYLTVDIIGYRHLVVGQ